MYKAPGVDAVGTRMLMELSEVISDTVAVLSSKSCLVLTSDWQSSSWSITPMAGGGALWHAKCDRH